MSIGELINWYLGQGFTIGQIRAMFPGFFAGTPVYEEHWEAADWMRQWDGFTSNYDHDTDMSEVPAA